jgi:hypothetical protein
VKFWWKPYEPLLEVKPVSTDVVLQDLVAKEGAEMCLHFPPDEGTVDWMDPSLEKRLSGRLDELPKPDLAQVEVIAQLVKWDLEHEHEAIDHYFRNNKHKDVCPSADAENTLHFLWRGVLELFFMRKDESTGHIKRKDLIAAAEQLPAQFTKLKERVN